VAKLLNKLLIEQTKSRSGRTNDNALVEGKNGSIIRKHMGYWHIEQKYAPLINEFYRKHFNVYLNFHRPCGFATVKVDEKGKRSKKYETYQTPHERLKSIVIAARSKPSEPEKYLREGVNLEVLDGIAAKQTDNECAQTMQEAKDRLFRKLFPGKRAGELCSPATDPRSGAEEPLPPARVASAAPRLAARDGSARPSGARALKGCEAQPGNRETYSHYPPLSIGINKEKKNQKEKRPAYDGLLQHLNDKKRRLVPQSTTTPRRSISGSSYDWKMLPENYPTQDEPEKYRVSNADEPEMIWLKYLGRPVVIWSHDAHHGRLANNDAGTDSADSQLFRRTGAQGALSG
jgi:hypothetical protein